VAYWDKAGCGRSGGDYDHNQSIQSSAEEAIAAIEAIKKLQLPKSDNLGFWSISRGGWIVPKVSELYDGVKFWISVSGTTELDNGRYMLEANLRALKRSDEKIEPLMSEWDNYQRILVSGGTLDEFNANTKNLAVMYPNLEDTLASLSIPVMAILGRLDTQIDWRDTGELYSRASQKGDMQLTTVYLDHCNHVMRKSVTGGVNETLPPDSPLCDGYFDAMEKWVRSLDAIDASEP